MRTLICGLLLLGMTLICGCRRDENFIGPTGTPGEWTLVHEDQTPSYLAGLSFADQAHGWVVGDSGKILRTSDGGDSWEAQNSGTNVSLRCVYFADAQKGWIGGGSNSLGMTTDGGVTWIWQHLPGETRRMFTAMSFVDNRTGWVVDNFGGIFHTEDGGLTWAVQSSTVAWAITSVQFLDAQEGWATATKRLVLHTTDGGKSWGSKTLDGLAYGGTAMYEDIFFVDRYTGWIATNMLASSIADPVASFVRTSDTGGTWVCQRQPETPMIHSIVFVNNNAGWAAIYGGILATYDGGEQWTSQLKIPGAIVVDISFVDETHGWAVTFGGSIYRYHPL